MATFEEMEVTVTDFASIVGITARRVQQLIQDGVLTRSKQGRMMLKDNLRSYIEYLRRDQLSDDEAKLEKERMKAETAIKVSKAKINQMEARELEGKMHRSEDVEALVGDMVFAYRNALLALPGRAAVEAAEASTPAAVAEVLKKQVYAVLQEMSEYQYNPEQYEERVRARRAWEPGEKNG